MSANSGAGFFLSTFTSAELEATKVVYGQTGKAHPLARLADGESPALLARLDQAVRTDSRVHGGKAELLAKLRSRMLAVANVDDAAAAIAEYRAFADLDEVGFEVRRIPESNAKRTPDYTIVPRPTFWPDGGVEADIEVAARQDAPATRKTRVALQRGLSDEFIDQGRKTDLPRGTFTIRTAEMFPGGAPNPAKVPLGTESVQTNFISKITSTKQDEKQFSAGRVGVLWLDFLNFGSVPSFYDASIAEPLSTSPYGLLSGGLWQAMYGETGDPIFEGGRTIYKMGHPGRFHRGNSSKLSAICVAVHEATIVYENPENLLPEIVRMCLARLPWVNLTLSVVEINQGDVLDNIRINRAAAFKYKDWIDHLF